MRLGALTVAILLFTALRAVEAQPAPRMARIGVVAAFPLPAESAESFRQGLRDSGWVEGHNLRIEYRFSEGRPERLSGLVAELIGFKVDILVALSTPVALAAKEATRTIPIIMIGVGDPVGARLVESLARPGGNVTGFSPVARELAAKRLQLLAELVPGLSKVVALWNPANPGSALALRQTQSAARALSVKVAPVELQRAEELEEALAKVKRERPDGLMVQPEAVQVNSRARIIEFAAENRLPAMYGAAQYTAAGGLIAYVPTGANPWRQAANYIDRILKGAKPGELPVELPTRFALIINLKTAKALGFTIPAALLLRADRLIE